MNRLPGAAGNHALPLDGTCGSCRFRGNEGEDEHGLVPRGYFLCVLIKHERVRYDERSAPPGRGAFVCDGSDYYAALCVEDDFGCIKWERK